MKMRIAILAALAALAFPAAARASTCTIAHTFVTGETLLPASLNANPNQLVVCVNHINNQNIDASGIYASQIVPASSATATFSGVYGYTFQPTSTTVVPLTIAPYGTPTADILDVTASNLTTKYFWLDSAGVPHMSAAPTISTFTTAGVLTNNTSGVVASSTAPTMSGANISAATIPQSALGAFAGVNVGGALTGATTGAFSGAVTIGGLASANGGIVLPYNVVPVAGSNQGAIGVDANGYLTFRAYNGNGHQWQNADGTTTYGKLGALAINGTKQGLSVNGSAAINGGYVLTPGQLGISTGVGAGSIYFGDSGTTTALGLLGWSSTTGWSLSVPGAGAAAATIDTGGNVTATSYNVSSSRAVKKNIRALDALGIADATRAVRFCYKRERCRPDETRHAGFIADDTPDTVAPHHRREDVGATAAVALAAVGELHAQVRMLWILVGVSLAVALAALTTAAIALRTVRA